MSIRGRIVLGCSERGCHAEAVIDAEDLAPERSKRGTGVNVTAYADGWVVDEDGEVHCPACCEERDEAYERAAARDRNDDFARTGGRDWT